MPDELVTLTAARFRLKIFFRRSLAFVDKRCRRSPPQASPAPGQRVSDTDFLAGRGQIHRISDELVGEGVESGTGPSQPSIESAIKGYPSMVGSVHVTREFSDMRFEFVWESVRVNSFR